MTPPGTRLKQAQAARNCNPARFAHLIRSGKTPPGQRYFMMHFTRNQNAFVKRGKEVKPTDAGKRD